MEQENNIQITEKDTTFSEALEKLTERIMSMRFEMLMIKITLMILENENKTDYKHYGFYKKYLSFLEENLD